VYLITPESAVLIPHFPSDKLEDFANVVIIVWQDDYIKYPPAMYLKVFAL
jgi:hypothetical protein